MFQLVTTNNNKEGLQLSPIQVDPEYKKKWNIHQNDFVCLTKNGELISPNLYRVSGRGVKLDDNYILILKYVEDFYSDEITKDKNRKRHLNDIWVIIDKNGIEKVEFKKNNIDSPYLVKDSILYSIKDKYYNIETNELLGESYSARIESETYIFLQIERNKVLRINKKDGTTKIIE